MKKILIASILVISLVSCSKNNDISGLTIDPKIKAGFEKHSRESKEYGKMGGELMLIYENAFLGQFYENDTLRFSNKDINVRQPFKCYYFWEKDNTLSINGGFGIFGSMGFYIRIKDKKAAVFHMLSSDDFPTYAYKEKDSLISRLEVPCKETKIVLSEVPDKTKKQVIYGYVEFKSDDYYGVSGSFPEGGNPPKKKSRSNMKIYFKSIHSPIIEKSL